MLTNADSDCSHLARGGVGGQPARANVYYSDTFSLPEQLCWNRNTQASLKTHPGSQSHLNSLELFNIKVGTTIQLLGTILRIRKALMYLLLQCASYRILTPSLY